MGVGKGLSPAVGCLGAQVMPGLSRVARGEGRALLRACRDLHRAQEGGNERRWDDQFLSDLFLL